MAIRQRQKRNEDAAVRQPGATPLADATMIGGLAGGLVMAIAETNAAEPQNEKLAAPIVPDHDSAQPPEAPVVDHQEAVATPDRPTASAPEPTIEQVAISQVDEPVAGPETSVPDAPAPAQTIDPTVEDIASQIANTVVRVAESMSAGADSDTIAVDIVGAAREIAARLQPEPAGDVVTNIAEQILDAVDPSAIVDHALAATQNIAGDITGTLADGTDIAQSVLDDVASLTDDALSLASDLPASLLGFEGSDMPGGLLTDVFYDDGQAEAAPLSDLAQSVSLTDAPLSLAMLGQSYGDADLGHLPVNALGLL